ncbi:STAS domain-containing protein [Spirillospora sp. CA-253888]
MDDALRLSTHRTGTTLTITVTGDLDFATAPHLLAYLDSILTQLTRPPSTNGNGRRPVQHLAIDTSDVTFIDAYGLGVLVAARNHARDQHLTLCLDPVPALLQRLITITGTHHLLTAPPPPPAPPGETDQADQTDDADA